MKRFFFGVLALILLGAGCVGSGSLGTEESYNADNDPAWWLSFDLPEGWVRVAHYDGGTKTMPTDETINVRLTDIVLQNTDLPILFDGDEPSESWESYIESDYAYVRVFRYTSMRPVPDTATDLGNGFYQDEWYGLNAYWYPAEFGNYLFTIETDGEQDMDLIQSIIFSAQENDLSDEL